MRILIYVCVISFVSIGSNFAQNVPGVPNGAITKDSRDDYDNGIRLRSIELERVKREGYRSALAEKAAENRRLNYSQIKKDFEQLQKLQNEIVKTYVTGERINYGRISELAAKLNNSARRLDENLSLSVEESEEKSNRKDRAPDDVKDLIVVLDKTIGKFINNAVFENLNFINTKTAAKAEFDLKNIIRVSEVLARQAEKQK